MNIYLVSAKVSLINYPSNVVELGRETRLVKAECSLEAAEKFDRYWGDKDKPYSHSYYTTQVTVHEMIE
jgi:hypothetical protein